MSERNYNVEDVVDSYETQINDILKDKHELAKQRDVLLKAARLTIIDNCNIDILQEAIEYCEGKGI